MKTTTRKLFSALVPMMVLFTLAGCVGGAVITPPEEKPKPIITPDPTVHTSAMLVLTATAGPAMISVGQDITLAVTVRNTGEATASGVVPTTPKQTGNGHAVIKTAPNPVDIAGGQSQLFTFILTATDSGSITFEVAADGIDIEHDHGVSADPASASVVVQSAAMLMVQSLRAPASGLIGADFTVTMTVANGGQSAALATTPDALVLSGSGSSTLVSGPTPNMASIPQGSSATFTWVYKASGSGAVIFTGGAKGIDGNSQTPLIASALSSSPIDVNTPAKLEAMMSIPTSLSANQTFTATLVVTNTGSATAKNVLPSPLLPASVSATGNASAAAAVSPAAVDIPGGGTVTFTWDYLASGAGTMSISAGAGGTDEASGAVINSSLAKSNAATVMAPSALAVTSLTAPSLLNRGQAFNVTMVVKNNGGTAANAVLPNPNPATVAPTGGANATTATTLTAQNIAPGASATFTWSYVENGTAVGNLSFTAGARGTAAGTGTVVNANPSSSNLSVVVAPPSLIIDSVTLPAKISRGQTYNAVVVVRNSGGSAANNVLPSLTQTVTGMAAATPTAQTPVNIAGGAKATFTYPYLENGSGPGALKLSVTASGTDVTNGQTLFAAAVQSQLLTVETPAQLTISALSLPATLNRGASFALSMTITNSGQATATNVTAIPSPPTAVVTGGVVVSTSSTATPVTILGGTSQTFTWLYTETGTGAGTVSFNGAAQGLDGNSAKVLAVASRVSNASAISVPMGCNGSLLYAGFGGRSLDGDRLDQLVGTDRQRVKPYAVLVTDYNRVLGLTPSYIQGQAATFNQPAVRWAEEQEMSAISMYQAFQASFQGCLTYTGTSAQYGANPTAATASTECTNFQKKFWSRIPSAAETTACVTFATSAVNNDANARRRWAYTCASVLTSTGFLAH